MKKVIDIAVQKNNSGPVMRCPVRQATVAAKQKLIEGIVEPNSGIHQLGECRDLCE